MDRITDELIFELWAVKHLMDDRGLPKREALETSKEILNRLTTEASSGQASASDVLIPTNESQISSSGSEGDEIMESMKRLSDYAKVSRENVELKQENERLTKEKAQLYKEYRPMENELRAEIESLKQEVDRLNQLVNWNDADKWNESYNAAQDDILELKKEIEMLREQKLAYKEQLKDTFKELESLKQQPDCVELLEWMRDKVVTHPKGVWMVWDGTNYIGYKTDSELLALYQSNTKDE